nr:Serine threonine protein kinase-related domain containing protein [Haemonchus contortus]
MDHRLYWTSSAYDDSLPSEFITGRSCHCLYKPDPPRSLDDSDCDSSSEYAPRSSSSSHRTVRHEYHSLKLLGTGAYGEVHLIRNPFNRKYIPNDVIALKVIDLDHRREGSKQKFRNEVALQNALSPQRHPNIVQCYGSNYEVELNQLQIFLEYVNRDDLWTVIDSRRHGGIGVHRARDYYRQLMRGVDFLHNIGIAHRDLKPDNLIINSNGLLKITDFGMATKIEFTHTNQEIPLDRMCGTRDYMSPQMFKKKYLGTKNDVWSSGVILLLMIAGRRCWRKARRSDPHFSLWLERKLPRPFDRLTPGTLEILEYILDVIWKAVCRYVTNSVFLTAVIYTHFEVVRISLTVTLAVIASKEPRSPSIRSCNSNEDADLNSYSPTTSEESEPLPIHYNIIKDLGSGSFGEVSLIANPLSRSVVSARKIALKRIRLSKLNSKQLEEVDYEVMLQQTLTEANNKYIVRCYGSRVDHVLNEKHIYLEYVDGSDLFEIAMNKGGIDRRRAANYFRQLLQGLSFLHGLYVAHRDIKPENILIDNRGNLKIADFGLADCYRESDDEPDRRLSRICGSYEYLSPQVFNTDYSGPKNDVWSAGIVLIVMLTGDLAWDRADISDTNYALWVNGELPPLLKTLDQSTLSIINDALDIDENRRPTCQQLLKHPWLRTSSKRSYKSNNNGEDEGSVKRSKLHYR